MIARLFSIRFRGDSCLRRRLAARYRGNQPPRDRQRTRSTSTAGRASSQTARAADRHAVRWGRSRMGCLGPAASVKVLPSEGIQGGGPIQDPLNPRYPLQRLSPMSRTTAVLPPFRPSRAEDGNRTHDPHLGHVVLSARGIRSTPPPCCSVHRVSTPSTGLCPRNG